MGNLLFLCHRLPYPPEKGEKIRAWHMLRHLARAHRVHLGCFIDDPEDWRHVATLRSLCADVACFDFRRARQHLEALLGLRPGRPLTLDYFRDARLQEWVDRTLRANRIDGVFVFSSSMAPYVMGRNGHGTGVRVLDMVDVDSEKWTAYAAGARWPKRLIWSREGSNLLAFEQQAAGAFDHTLFVSKDEWLRFVTLAPECAPRAGWIENGVDLEKFSPRPTHRSPFDGDGPHLVFTGTMDYWPNVDAVIWFARGIMPLLRRQGLQPHFHIVGANPGREVMKLAEAPDVHVTGRVLDTRPYLAFADVAVAPLRIARGIQNKVLEAMAMGRPVVASPEAFEGVRARPGRDLLVAGGAEATARAIADILAGRHPGLGAAGRAAVEAGYEWAVTLAELDTLFPAAPPAEGAPPRLLRQAGALM